MNEFLVGNIMTFSLFSAEVKVQVNVVIFVTCVLSRLLVFEWTSSCDYDKGVG